jgi:hypothetical protein
MSKFKTVAEYIERTRHKQSELCKCGHKLSQHSTQGNNSFCLAIKTFVHGFDYYCDCQSYSPKCPTVQCEVIPGSTLQVKNEQPQKVEIKKAVTQQTVQGGAERGKQ